MHAALRILSDCSGAQRSGVRAHCSHQHQTTTRRLQNSVAKMRQAQHMLFRTETPAFTKKAAMRWSKQTAQGMGPASARPCTASRERDEDWSVMPTAQNRSQQTRHKQPRVLTLFHVRRHRPLRYCRITAHTRLHPQPANVLIPIACASSSCLPRQAANAQQQPPPASMHAADQPQPLLQAVESPRQQPDNSRFLQHEYWHNFGCRTAL